MGDLLKLSTFQRHVALEQFDIHRKEGNNMKSVLFANHGLFTAIIAGMTSAAVTAGTYTWYPETKATGKWSSTDANWNDGNTAGTHWVNGNDASITMGRQRTITVSEAVSAANITMSGGYQALYLEGSGPLSWTGWIKQSSGGNVYLKCPLADNGNGLRFDATGPIYIQGSNRHTGGNYIKSSSARDFRPLFIDGPGDDSDLALGSVPGTVATNIFIEGGYVYLSVNTPSRDISVDSKRMILIRSAKTFYICPRGILRIHGNIRAENKSGSPYPLDSCVFVRTNYTSGCTMLYGTNYFGKLRVVGKMEIADGKTTLITAGAGTSSSAALSMTGNGAPYRDEHGYLKVSGGEVVNNQDSYRFTTDSYGHLDVAGGHVNVWQGEILNAYDSPGKMTVRDGGLVECRDFRLSQTATGNGGELILGTGGTLRVRQIGLDFTEHRKGVVHFDGGAIQSSAGNSGVSVTKDPGNANWAGCDFVVEAGGAVLDTSYSHSVWFGRPLLTGVAAGQTDGGLKCILRNNLSVVLTCAGSTYTGPTRLEASGAGTGTRTLECRVANALPATTTLQIGPGTRVGFNDDFTASGNDLAQTVARVEGVGSVMHNSLLTVTDGVSPVFDGAFGTLSFENRCNLSGEYRVAGDASGCGRIKFNSAGQDISGLTLAVDTSKLDKAVPRGTYQILEAPNGFTGHFKVAEPWGVRYTDTAAFLEYRSPLVLIVR